MKPTANGHQYPRFSYPEKAHKNIWPLLSYSSLKCWPKDKLEDMDISPKKSAVWSGPTLQYWIIGKWLNIFLSFFRIWKSGIFVAIWSWFYAFLSNRLGIRAFWKKNLDFVFTAGLGRKKGSYEKHQKALNFVNVLLPNHLVYNKAKGV